MTTNEQTDPIPTRQRRRSLGDARFLAIIAVVGLAATTITTLGLAVAKTVALVGKTVSGWRDELVIVAVLETMDTYLLAVVQLIVAVGLYELFVGDLRLPAWLEAQSLDDLKKPILDVLVVFVAIKGIERFLVADKPVEGLYSVGAVALLIGAITAFSAMSARRAAKDRTGNE